MVNLFVEILPIFDLQTILKTASIIYSSENVKDQAICGKPRRWRLRKLPIMLKEKIVAFLVALID